MESERGLVAYTNRHCTDERSHNFNISEGVFAKNIREEVIDAKS
ncbi:hypothetical protein J27TS8_22210 [Robertmurraya siralis]|uniref:Uncharacterized protein n=1 Tax=Robertmurraya siralis TaxID=77777 RepID=A0A919WI54_9BACI|nr:hypothetical protein [Robertmurraya siralis]GIN62228.1 hypothetical protein J27TS8_22210 [Robertmurraya siralis]